MWLHAKRILCFVELEYANWVVTSQPGRHGSEVWLSPMWDWHQGWLFTMCIVQHIQFSWLMLISPYRLSIWETVESLTSSCLIFMFCWLCISIYLCNKNQLDALFILSLFRHSTSTCFGHICSPSLGGVLCIYGNWYVLCFLVDSLLVGFHPNPANSQSTKKQNMYQLLYIYTQYNTSWWSLGVGQHRKTFWNRYTYIHNTSWWWATNMPETCRGWRNKVRIVSASSWFLFRSSSCLFSFWEM